MSASIYMCVYTHMLCLYTQSYFPKRWKYACIPIYSYMLASVGFVHTHACPRTHPSPHSRFHSHTCVHIRTFTHIYVHIYIYIHTVGKEEKLKSDKQEYLRQLNSMRVKKTGNGTEVEKAKEGENSIEDTEQ